ncbi:MAG: phosphatidylserine decarboxylase [Gammaproteobacteria bacterium]|nr:phosphatidylserine decarboxylase [Gammaproteobacteria bacterium]
MPCPVSILSHHCLPQHAISRWAGRLAHAKTPFVKNALIRSFVRRYPINMVEAAEPNLDAYASFNDFFTRTLKPEARPLDLREDSILSPADGTISEIGDIENNTLIQAKGRYFDLDQLLGQQTYLSALFQNGKFATIYLAPSDYHRVHMPLAGQLRDMIYVPGRLFSVNFKSSQHIPQLFARNERVIAIFDTVAGPMAMILVGAMIVASIHTQWAGQVAPSSLRTITVRKYTDVTLEKGQEMGYFSLGSTVIVLFGPQKTQWNPGLQTLSTLKMGESIGKMF